MKKKGDIWISAAIYFGLGVVVITLILTAGMPVINTLRDKNTWIQTKNIMFKLDNNIREVIRGGAGEQRYIEMEINKGEFRINSEGDSINWSMNSKALVSDPGFPIEEGSLNIITEKSNVKGEYIIKMGLDYSKIADIKYTSMQQTFKGLNQLIIKNNGLTSDDRINVTITNA